MDWHQYVEIDARYYRPTEVDVLLGDASKAREKLRWQARVRFPELVRMMIAADLEAETNRAESSERNHEFLER